MLALPGGGGCGAAPAALARVAAAIAGRPASDAAATPARCTNLRRVTPIAGRLARAARRVMGVAAPGAAGLALVGLGAHEVGGRYRPEAAGAHLLDHGAEPGAPVGVVVQGRLDEVAALEL